MIPVWFWKLLTFRVLIHFTFALTTVLNFFKLFICIIPACLSWALIRCHCTLFLRWHRRSVWGWLGAISPEAPPSPSPQNLLSWGEKNKGKYSSSQFCGFFTPLHAICFVRGGVLQLSRAEFISLFDGPPFVAFLTVFCWQTGCIDLPNKCGAWFHVALYCRRCIQSISWVLWYARRVFLGPPSVGLRSMENILHFNIKGIW